MIELGSDKNIIARKTPCHRIYFLQQVLYICEVVPLAAKPRSSLVWRLFYWQPALPVDQWGAFMSLLSRSSHSVELCPPRCLRRWYPRYDGNLKSEKEVSLNRTFPSQVQSNGSNYLQLVPENAECQCQPPSTQQSRPTTKNFRIENMKIVRKLLSSEILPADSSLFEFILLNFTFHSHRSHPGRIFEISPWWEFYCG